LRVIIVSTESGTKFSIVKAALRRKSEERKGKKRRKREVVRGHDAAH
jgi:hypothetical protein